MHVKITAKLMAKMHLGSRAGMGDTDYSYPAVVEKQHSVGVVNEHLRHRDFPSGCVQRRPCRKSGQQGDG